MEFRKIKIADLIPASYNPRKKLKKGDREYEKIRNSITEFGYVEPVIVNSDMTIIGGHQRATVLTDLGYEEIDCIVIDIDKQKEKALNIALNKITGEWNKELLADLIADLQDSDFDVSFTGFEPPEIEQLFNSVHDKKVTEDDFDIDAELEKPAVAKMGDVWTLGRHRLVVGDSTLPETYDVLMAGAKANLVVTDPPYNANYEGSAGKIKNDNMPDKEFYQFLFAAFVNMEQHMEQDASIYVFHADTEGLNFRKAFQAAGFYLSGCCIWKKQSLVLGRSPYQWQHEPCLFGWKKGGKHNWYSDRKQTTIWEFDRPKKSDSHPTQKPVGLIAYPIKNSSMSNCIVLDPFGGSGSTLMACEQTNRICYTIELDEKFADVIVNRYIEQAGSAGNVFVERDGVKIPYAELEKGRLRMDENGKLTLGSLFSGSGAFELGGLLAGIRPVWASEIEMFPIRVTTKRLPFVKHYGDVNSIRGDEIEPVDIITSGSPCTDLSIAGKRAGLDGRQSGLFIRQSGS